MGADILVHHRIAEHLPDRLHTRDGRAEARLSEDGAGLSVRYRDDQGQTRLVLQLVPRDGLLELRVPAGDLRLCAERGSIAIEAAEQLQVRARHADWHVGSWHLRASRIRERAETILFEAQGAVHTRAERVRTVARGMVQILSRKTSLRSRDDTLIDGRRVLLG